MTITTAKLRAVPAPLVPAALLGLLLAPHAHAAWQVVPSVTLRQIYTDNVALSRDEDARSRFITEIAPGLNLQNNGPRLKLSADYHYTYYAFDDDDVEGTRHSSAQLRADMRSTLLDDLLFFDADARVSQQAVSAFGPQVSGNGYAGANRANVRSYRVSPYLQHQFGTTAQAQLRYVRDSVDAGSAAFGSSDSDNLALSIASGPQFRRVGWGLQYNHQRLSESGVQDAIVRMVNVNLRYRLLNSFSLTAGGGYDEYDYQSLGGKTEGKSWNTGFEWTPSARTSLMLGAGKRYYGDSYSLQALHRSRHSVWSINYSDSVSTTRSQYLLPATIDTAATLDRLFTPQIADPVARRQAVDAYIRANQLPLALADNIHYLSNRFFLMKQLRASTAFSSARTTLVLSAFGQRREALSMEQAGSALSGSFENRLNENTDERGGSALFNMRLSGRSSLGASLTRTRSMSKSLNIESRHTSAQLVFSHQFSPRTQGLFELRRTSGSTGSQIADYRENAATASLSLRF